MRTHLRRSILFCLFLVAWAVPSVAQNRLFILSVEENTQQDPNDGGATFHVRALNSETVYTRTNGSAPEFSDDSRWVGMMVRPAEEEADRLREQKEPVPTAFHLINVVTGDSMIVSTAASFTLSGMFDRPA